MATQINRRLVFFNPARAEISCEGKTATLGEAATACLSLLLTHQGEIVDKQKIFEACWGTRGIMVSDASIRQVITQVRRALLSVGAPSDVLVTKPRLGYLLTPGCVTDCEPAVTLQDAILLPAHIHKGKKSKSGLYSNRLILIAVVTSLILSVAIVWVRIHASVERVDYLAQGTLPSGLAVFTQAGYKSPPSEAHFVENMTQKSGYLSEGFRYIYLNKTELPEFTSAFICKAPIDNSDSHCISMLIVQGDHGY